MSVSNFIKQNFALTLGIALPVLLVGGFMLLAAVPKKLGPPPQYAVLFSVQKYEQTASPYNVDYIVKGDKVYARLTERLNDYSNYKHELFRYDAKTEQLQKIEPDLPADIGEQKKIDVLLKEFDNITISTASKSPDGFTLENGGYRSRGLAGEIFGGGRGRYDSRLRHEKGYAYKIPEYAGTPFYANLEFIGWVKP